MSSTALVHLLLLLLPGTNLTHDSSCAAQNHQLHTSSESTGNWITASGHLITVMVGAGVLSLPSAMSWLGWIGGLLSLLTFYVSSLWCSLMLAAVYQVDGRTHPTYSAAVSGILGRGSSRALAVVQRTMLCLAAIGYQIAAADSMSYMAGRSCPAKGQCEGLRHGQMTLIFAGGCWLQQGGLPNPSLPNYLGYTHTTETAIVHVKFLPLHALTLSPVSPCAP